MTVAKLEYIQTGHDNGVNNDLLLGSLRGSRLSMQTRPSWGSRLLVHWCAQFGITLSRKSNHETPPAAASENQPALQSVPPRRWPPQPRLPPPTRS